MTATVNTASSADSFDGDAVLGYRAEVQARMASGASPLFDTHLSRARAHHENQEGNTLVILRIWRGVVATDRAAEYADLVRRTGIAGYRETPGNVDAQVAVRQLGDGHSEIITLSWWTDLDEIRAFAGADVGAARYYPEDDRFLLDRDAQARHYEVLH